MKHYAFAVYCWTLNTDNKLSNPTKAYFTPATCGFHISDLRYSIPLVSVETISAHISLVSVDFSQCAPFYITRSTVYWVVNTTLFTLYHSSVSVVNTDAINSGLFIIQLLFYSRFPSFSNPPISRKAQLYYTFEPFEYIGITGRFGAFKVLVPIPQRPDVYECMLWHQD